MRPRVLPLHHLTKIQSLIEMLGNFLPSYLLGQYMDRLLRGVDLRRQIKSQHGYHNTKSQGAQRGLVQDLAIFLLFFIPPTPSPTWVALCTPMIHRTEK